MRVIRAVYIQGVVRRIAHVTRAVKGELSHEHLRTRCLRTIYERTAHGAYVARIARYPEFRCSGHQETSQGDVRLWAVE